jgi:hypothetical protein
VISHVLSSATAIDDALEFTELILSLLSDHFADNRNEKHLVGPEKNDELNENAHLLQCLRLDLEEISFSKILS